MNRRRFLRLGASTLAGTAALSGVAPDLAASSASRPPERSALDDAPGAVLGTASSPQRVIVVGAGLAGLTAGYELKQAGHEVTILEATLQPGGRVRTLREPFAEGLYVEAGATLIPSNHADVVAYARHFDLPLRTVAPNSFDRCYFIDGACIPADAVPLHQDTLPPAEREAGLSGLRMQYLMPIVAEMGTPTAPDWPTPDVLPFDDLTFAELLRQQGASSEAIDLLGLGYYNTWGDGIHETSALYILKQSLLLAGHELYTVEGGNDRLARAFAAALDAELRYGAPVRRIEQDETEVRVVYGRGAQRHVARADRLVCTVPLPVLRHLKVHPPLSRAKRRAVAALPSTDVTRVFLQLRRAPAHPQPGVWSPVDGPLEVLHESTYARTPTRTILSTFVAGAGARRLAERTPEDRIAWTIRQLEALSPGLGASVEGGTSIAWQAEEWFRGAYLWYRPGQIRAHAHAVAAPEGRLHFAGEHTSRYEGWIQGAITSGVRAAREVHATA